MSSVVALSAQIASRRKYTSRTMPGPRKRRPSVWMCSNTVCVSMFGPYGKVENQIFNMHKFFITFTMYQLFNCMQNIYCDCCQYIFRVKFFLIPQPVTRGVNKSMDASFGCLVGCIEDLRRFSGISAISRIGSRR